MQLTPESTVLDMGCGKGQACVDVARTAGCSVVGVDLSGTLGPAQLGRAEFLSRETSWAVPQTFTVLQPIISDIFRGQVSKGEGVSM
ncbi:hypothetical protein AK812_SmicGene1216 [Symbiodinium microadriaticum]|uniref:Methyltransferase domain-containing protein n=1 Tax=Symbiodinium microadriaticum TaxID=2951 RepID=A0A1Q9F4J4_SYMMI|nr:hypothetical protein AK812_SmicGene1216 [Symbiodinium microadriaticum]